MSVRKRVLPLLLCGTLAGAAAQAQTFPTKPLRYIIP